MDTIGIRVPDGRELYFPATITLSTGVALTVRQPSLAELALDGQIPDVLTPVIENLRVRRLVALGLRDESEDEPPLLPEQRRLAKAFVRLLVMRGAASPIVVESLADLKAARDAGQAAIDLASLNGLDVQTIYTRVLGDASYALALFSWLEGTDDAVDAVPAGDHDADSAGGSAGDPAQPDVGPVDGELRGERVRDLGGEPAARHGGRGKTPAAALDHSAAA